MEFEQPLQPATLVRRYKRFLADVETPDGTLLTVHTPNTGSMRGCAEPGTRIWYRDSGNPKRKYPLSWELTELADGTRVGVNTARSNALVREAVENGTIRELAGRGPVRPEVRLGASRIDFAIGDGEPPCYVEVKNVTMAEAGVAMFPDAVTTRGTRHIDELRRVAESGGRGVLLFCVQRGDVDRLQPADAIDPEYGRALRRAVAAGVEVLAYRARIDPSGVRLETPLPVEFPSREAA